jgi:glycosyltransferase involved in cell wall biosynthesis
MDISILIAAFNEEASIGPLLRSICEGGYGRHRVAEVLVYDDCSTDTTADVVERAAACYPVIRVFHATKRDGLAVIVRRLVAETTGDAIVRINADTAVEAHAIERLVDAVAAGATIAIGANVTKLERRTVPAMSAAFALAVVQRLKAGPHRQHYAVGNLVAFASAPLKALEIPSGIINDDHYIAASIVRNGGSAVFVPEARCRIKMSSTFEDYWRHSRRVLEGERQLERLYGIRRAPLGAVLWAVAATAPRKPVDALCWAFTYCWSSMRSAPLNGSIWQVSESTKGHIS